MKVLPVAKQPCRLAGGEVRRVPQRRGGQLIGYHVCCPRCAFVTPALEGVAELSIVEADAPEDLTFSRPLRCLFCKVLIHLQQGELRLEEDADVRDVRFR